jgi:1-phosphofructokinase
MAAPRFQARDHRGAGDSMAAGLAVSCARGLELEAVLRLAMTARTLNVTRHRLGNGRRDSIEVIASRIEIRPLSA